MRGLMLGARRLLRRTDSDDRRSRVDNKGGSRTGAADCLQSRTIMATICLLAQFIKISLSRPRTGLARISLIQQWRATFVDPISLHSLCARSCSALLSPRHFHAFVIERIYDSINLVLSAVPFVQLRPCSSNDDVIQVYSRISDIQIKPYCRCFVCMWVARFLGRRYK